MSVPPAQEHEYASCLQNPSHQQEAHRPQVLTVPSLPCSFAASLSSTLSCPLERNDQTCCQPVDQNNFLGQSGVKGMYLGAQQCAASSCNSQVSSPSEGCAAHSSWLVADRTLAHLSATLSPALACSSCYGRHVCILCCSRHSAVLVLLLPPLQVACLPNPAADSCASRSTDQCTSDGLCRLHYDFTAGNTCFSSSLAGVCNSAGTTGYAGCTSVQTSAGSQACVAKQVRHIIADRPCTPAPTSVGLLPSLEGHLSSDGAC